MPSRVMGVQSYLLYKLLKKAGESQRMKISEGKFLFIISNILRVCVCVFLNRIYERKVC